MKLGIQAYSKEIVSLVSLVNPTRW